MLRAKNCAEKMNAGSDLFHLFLSPSTLGIHISHACCSHRAAFPHSEQARPKITVCSLYRRLRADALEDASSRLTPVCKVYT